ncbi:MAG: methyltransferase domain-containing protein, partial [Anaerolineales bacterium]|nr:methyltransferase domain-containing protein [Anaerolineales bacterium]
MQDEIIARLRRLNQEFYQSYATSFAETRARLQPGVVRCLDAVSLSTSVLDLGCGNGELARGLHARGHEGQYFGLDSSIQLIALARQRCIHPRAQFRLADLAQETWISALPTSFDRVFAFAVFHHVPSQELRQRILRQVHTILSTEGNFVLSNWNFMESPRLRERILPWETINLRAEDLEEG